MPCDLNQLVSDGAQFQNLPKSKYEIYSLYMWALLLKAIGGDDLTDISALLDDMKQYRGLSQSDMQAAYLQVLYESLAGTDTPAPTQAEVDAVIRMGQCTPPDIVRKAELCVLSQLATAQSRQN